MEILTDHSYLKKLIDDIAKEQNFESYQITSVTTNQKGEGFMGKIFMITIKNSCKILNFVIKLSYEEEKIRKIAPIRNSFLNEIFMYTQLESEFRKLEKENNIVSTQFFPKCYKACSEESKEFLCLENLKSENFEIFDKKDILDDDHVGLIFLFYGRFHGYSYALKEKNPEIYQEIVGNLHNIYDELVANPNSSFALYMKSFDKLIEKYFEPKKDDEIKKKYNKYMGNGIIDEYLKIVNEKPDFSTILHGDCWSNNMMFKYQRQNNQKKLIDMRFLDLQLAKEGSPVCDLSYALYSGASKSVFDNLDKYLKIYHDSLSSCLKKFNCNPEKVIPYEVLQNHWKKYSRFGMMLAFAVIKLKCVNQDNCKDYTDVDSDEPDVDTFGTIEFNEEEFKKRAMDVVNHLSEIDAL